MLKLSWKIQEVRKVVVQIQTSHMHQHGEKNTSKEIGTYPRPVLDQLSTEICTERKNKIIPLHRIEGKLISTGFMTNITSKRNFQDEGRIYLNPVLMPSLL